MVCEGVCACVCQCDGFEQKSVCVGREQQLSTALCGKMASQRGGTRGETCNSPKDVNWPRESAVAPRRPSAPPDPA